MFFVAGACLSIMGIRYVFMTVFDLSLGPHMVGLLVIMIHGHPDVHPNFSPILPFLRTVFFFF